MVSEIHTSYESNEWISNVKNENENEPQLFILSFLLFSNKVQLQPFGGDETLQ